MDSATECDAPVLANLLELYSHDLSAAFPSVQLGPDGRFGYPKLALYWSEPALRFPFLIRRSGKLAGFALATRGSPASEDPNALDVAEFFVLRSQRRTGLGCVAAHSLWNRLPGRWTVRVSEGNPGALPFWTKVIGQYTGGRALQTRRPGTPNAWQVFEFESSLKGAAR